MSKYVGNKICSVYEALESLSREAEKARSRYLSIIYASSDHILVNGLSHPRWFDSEAPEHLEEFKEVVSDLYDTVASADNTLRELLDA